MKEKTSFEIKLKGFDAKAKIKIIKEVRTITGLGLKEVCALYSILKLSLLICSQAKELVEKAPVALKDNLGKEEGEELVKVLTAAGAEVELL